jgi:hypothetical protein
MLVAHRSGIQPDGFILELDSVQVQLRRTQRGKAPTSIHEPSAWLFEPHIYYASAAHC